MMADRPIVKGEEIFHSYGDSMTSAQLLQTFGFVMPYPPPSSSRTEETANNNKGSANDRTEAVAGPPKRFLTPASLSTSKHLIPASRAIKQSGIPKRLQSKLALKKKARERQSKMLEAEAEDEEESWEVADLPVRNEDGILSEDILIDCNILGNNNGKNSNETTKDDGEDQKGGLTDEVITWMCLQFLPAEAHRELCDGGGRVTSLLDASILQDLYLGILVCRSLLLALHYKLDDYDGNAMSRDDDSEKKKNNNKSNDSNKEESFFCQCEITDQVMDRLESMLSLSLSSSLEQGPTVPHSAGAARCHHRRAKYGSTIRREELSNLKVWASQISCIMRCLYKELSDKTHGDDNEDDSEQEPKAKRAKHSSAP